MIRSKPAVKSQKIGVLSYNAHIKVAGVTSKEETINGIKNKWIQIKYNGQIGYIFGGYLSRFKGPSLDLRSFNKYAIELHGKLPKPEIKNSGESRESDMYHVSHSYVLGTSVTLYEWEYYEGAGEKLIFQKASLQEIYLIMIAIDSRYKTFDFKQSPDHLYRLDDEAGCSNLFDHVHLEIIDGKIIISTVAGC